MVAGSPWAYDDRGGPTMTDRAWARRMAALISRPASLVTVAVTIIALVVAGLAWRGGPHDTALTPSGSPIAQGPSSEPWATLQPSASLEPGSGGTGGATPVLSATSSNGPVVPTDVTFQLASADATPASLLADRLTVQPALAFAVAPDASDRTARLTPSEPLLPGVVYRFALHGVSGELLDTWAFQASQPLRVVGTLPEDEVSDVPLDTGIEITFDQDGLADVAAHVTIAPATPGRTEQHGRTFSFIPDKPLKPATIYSVVVSPGVAVSDTGEATTVETRFRFETAGPNQPSDAVTLEFQDVLSESATAERPIVGLWSSSDEDAATPPTTTIEVFRLADLSSAIDAFRSLRTQPTWALWSTEGLVDTTKLHRVVSANVRLEARRGAYLVRLPERLPAGWYLLQDKDGPMPIQTVLQVTDVAGYLAVSETKTLVWANDLATGKAIAGAVAALGGTEIARTNSDGLAIGSTPASLTSVTDGACTDPCDPVVTLRTGDGRAIFLPTDRSHDKLADYGGDLYWSDANPHYWNVFHTDRFEYRPGDLVNVWGMIRDRADGAVPKAVTVRRTPDPYDSEAIRPPVASATLTPAATGAFTESMSLAGLADGYYTLTVAVAGKDVASTQIDVGPIAKPAYRLEITTGRRVYIAGDRIKVTVGARFFEGTPVPGVPIRIAGYLRDEVAHTVTTDAGGSGVWRTTAAVDDSQEDVQETTFSAAPARAEEGEIAQSSREIFVFPSSRTIDATTRIAGGRVRVTGSVHVVAVDRVEAGVAAGRWASEVDARGQAVSGATVTLRFVELIPVRTQIGTEYDFIEKRVVPVYEDSIVERAAGTIRAKTTASGGFVGSVPATTKDHDYRVVVSVGDPDGHTARSTVYAERHPWSAYDEHVSAVLRPTTHSTDGTDTYGVGDRIDLTMFDPDTAQTSGDGSRYLFYQAQAGIRDVTVQASPRFISTFKAASIPNIEVAGVRFTKQGFVGTVRFEAAFRMSDRRLTVALTPDASSHTPGGRVTIAVRTRDASGSPVAATVILRAVDEKLYAIGAAFEDDPLAELYAPLGSGIRGTYLSHQPPLGETSGGDTTGGGGDGDRSDFRDSLLFTSVTTDAAGRGSTSFPLSDDLTSWRVSGSAVTRSLEAGYGSVLVPVGLPFFVDAPVAPEYLLADRPSLPVRVYGSAMTAGDAVTIRVTSPTLGFDSGPIRSAAFATETVPLPPLRLGRQTITIRATFGSGSSARTDALTRTFDVVSTRLATTRTAYVELPATGPFTGGPDRTTVVISDASSGRYFSLLTDLAAGGGSRLDRGLAADLAETILAGSFGSAAATGIPGGTFAADRYQTGDGGLALLPYSSSDLELSVQVALFAPDHVRRGELGTYLHGILLATDETSERKHVALAGLAGLGEPVMPAIRTALADPTLTDRERLMLGLGAAASGDAQTARSVAGSLVAAHGERQGELARLRIGKTAADTSEATALMAVLAASIGDPLAPRFWAYVQENPAADRLDVLTGVTYIARTLERLPVAPASFAYTLDGTRSTVELKPGETFELDLTAAQLASLQVKSVTGTLGVTTTWREPIVPADVKPDPDITLVRTVSPAVIDGADLVTVTLTATFGAQAASGCHQVTDLLPSGLTPVGSLAAWPDTEEDAGSTLGYTSPYDQSGPRIFFCADPDARHPTVTMRYFARVVTPGTYVWEPAVAESRSQAGHASLTAAGTVVVH